MSDEKTGGSVFPTSPIYNGDDEVVKAGPGMTLRDYFAAQALIGFLADGSQRKIAFHVEKSADRALIQDDKAKTAIINQLIAEGVYLLADAMLAERST